MTNKTKILTSMIIMVLMASSVLAVSPIITGPSNGDHINGIELITWTGDELPFTVAYQNGGAPISICPSELDNDCSWDTTTPSDGLYTIKVVDTNSGTDSILVTVDNTILQQTAITLQDPVNSLNEATATVSGDAAGEPDGSTIECKVEDTALNQVSGSTTATSNTFSLDLDLSTLNDDTLTATCYVVDLAGNTGLGGLEQTDTATKKSSLPTTTPVSIASDNADTTKAIPLDTVTVSFTTSEAVALPTVTIDGNAADAVNDLGANAYTATRVMQVGDTSGNVAFTIDFVDTYSNPGVQVIAIDTGVDVSFSDGAPVIENVAMLPASPTNDNTPVLTFDVTKDLFDVDGATIQVNDGTTIFVNGVDAELVCIATSGSYSCTLTYVGALADATYSVDMDADDVLGTSATQVSEPYNVDTTVPTSSDDYAGAGYETTNPVSVTITETDAAYSAGITSTLYCIDSADTCFPTIDITGGALVDVTNEGDNYLRYSTSDAAGNVQVTQSTLIQIDSVAPSETTSVPSTFASSPFNVGVTITEDISGLVGGTCTRSYNKAGAGYVVLDNPTVVGSPNTAVFSDTSGLIDGDIIKFKTECTDNAGNVMAVVEYDSQYSLGGVYLLIADFTQAAIESFGFVIGPHTVDTVLDLAGVQALGFVTGPHTVISQAVIESFGFVTGAHTVDTNTQLSEAQVDTFVSNNGYSTGAHTVDTNTQLSKLDIEAMGFNDGAHTVDTDTVYDDTAVNDRIDALGGAREESTEGFSMNFVQGWNTFRLPYFMLTGTSHTDALDVADFNVTTVLDDINGDFDYLAYYDGTEWLVHVPGEDNSVAGRFEAFPSDATSGDYLFHMHMTTTAGVSISTGTA
jgi:hypothetical protein